MKYIGNIKECIPLEVVEYVKNNTGIIKPNPTVEDYQLETYTKWVNAGFKIDNLEWEFFNEIPGIELTFPFPGQKVNWWISKLKPGDMFPLHVDTFPDNVEMKRYWVACEDHKPGHVFMYETNFLSNYKAGDMFELDPNDWHCACNLGFSTKISIQLIVV